MTLSEYEWLFTPKYDLHVEYVPPICDTAYLRLRNFNLVLDPETSNYHKSIIHPYHHDIAELETWILKHPVIWISVEFQWFQPTLKGEAVGHRPLNSTHGHKQPPCASPHPSSCKGLSSNNSNTKSCQLKADCQLTAKPQIQTFSRWQGSKIKALNTSRNMKCLMREMWHSCTRLCME